jgi:hypothetical protein
MRVALNQIHRTSPMILGRRGGLGRLGQTGCTYGGLDAAMQDWLSSLSNEPATAAAVGCGTGGGAPCPDPVTASEQQAVAIANDYCQVNANDAAEFGCPADPDCQNLSAVLTPYVQQAQALFNTYPSGVWSAEAAAAASGQYYNEVPTCPPGTSPSESGGVVTCWSLTTGQAEQPSYAPAVTSSGAPLQGSPQGPSLTIIPGNAASTTPAGATSVAPTPIPSAASIAANNALTVGTTAGTPGATAPITATVAPATAAAATSSTTSSDPFAFLTESAIGGIPNWALIAGGLAVVLILPSLMGGRR